MRLLSLSNLSIAVWAAASWAAPAANSTFYNPVLPGWHSDPSCIQVNGTYFCAISTFISFPGIPIYASKDLVNWKLVSHAWSRESQLPGISWATAGQDEGMYAPTLRYHAGRFFLICEYLIAPNPIIGVIFNTTNPYSDEAWGDPVIFRPRKIDPDLFWDDDGKVYAATQGIILQELNLKTGELSQPPVSLWNGTGGVWPEGPHIYKKDGWYYLLIAEGGTAVDHAITMARSRKITGPYEPYENNPLLTNRKTNEYFQTVGHGDLFQDPQGNWWGMCLATRSGPEWRYYPMGRETVLFPVTWEEGKWPVLQPVRGKMTTTTRSMPPVSRDVPGEGPFNGDPDVYDFVAGKPIPRNLVYWRVPREGAFTTTANGLQIVPSRNNLTGTPRSTATPELSGQRGLAFIGRRQTDTLFNFSIDVTLNPTGVHQEAGVTVFLTQVNHIDLGVVLLPPPIAVGATTAGGGAAPQLALRFHAEGTGVPPPDRIVPVPATWAAGAPVRLHVRAANATHYTLSASAGGTDAGAVVVGTASAELVSGKDNGQFTGSLVGVYATCNGAGSGQECPAGAKSYFQRWRYTGAAQQLSATESVPSADMAKGGS